MVKISALEALFMMVKVGRRPETLPWDCGPSCDPGGDPVANRLHSLNAKQPRAALNYRALPGAARGLVR